VDIGADADSILRAFVTASVNAFLNASSSLEAELVLATALSPPTP
jgi:hypothetical protein